VAGFLAIRGRTNLFQFTEICKDFEMTAFSFRNARILAGMPKIAVNRDRPIPDCFKSRQTACGAQ
jgi:hypothetical protein